MGLEVELWLSLTGRDRHGSHRGGGGMGPVVRSMYMCVGSDEQKFPREGAGGREPE